MNVLVVDDSRSLRLLIGTALRRAGHEVVEAVDGVEALAALEGRELGCVVCDLNMPRMDGLEFVERLRAAPGHAAVPVVMLTTESGADAVERGERVGVRTWIVKPFRVEQLVEAVEAAAAC